MGCKAVEDGVVDADLPIVSSQSFFMVKEAKGKFSNQTTKKMIIMATANIHWNTIILVM